MNRNSLVSKGARMSGFSTSDRRFVSTVLLPLPKGALRLRRDRSLTVAARFPGSLPYSRGSVYPFTVFPTRLQSDSTLLETTLPP